MVKNNRPKIESGCFQLSYVIMENTFHLSLSKQTNKHWNQSNTTNDDLLLLFHYTNSMRTKFTGLILQETINQYYSFRLECVLF